MEQICIKIVLIIATSLTIIASTLVIGLLGKVLYDVKRL